MIDIRAGELRTIVGARVHGKLDVSDIVIISRTGLCPPEHAALVRAADVEAVVIRGEWLQILRFDLLYVSRIL